MSHQTQVKKLNVKVLLSVYPTKPINLGFPLSTSRSVSHPIKRQEMCTRANQS